MSLCSILSIVSGSVQEAALEEMLRGIEAKWGVTEFEVKRHKNQKDTYLLDGFEDILALLEESNISMRTATSSRCLNLDCFYFVSVNQTKFQAEIVILGTSHCSVCLGLQSTLCCAIYWTLHNGVLASSCGCSCWDDYRATVQLLAKTCYASLPLIRGVALQVCSWHTA
jgi:hypothetical protein